VAADCWNFDLVAIFKSKADLVRSDETSGWVDALKVTRLRRRSRGQEHFCESICCIRRSGGVAINCCLIEAVKMATYFPGEAYHETRGRNTVRSVSHVPCRDCARLHRRLRHVKLWRVQIKQRDSMVQPCNVTE